MKRSALFLSFIALLLGIGNYAVKQSVVSLETELIRTHRSILKIEESMHLLNAEWSYLNEPGRLQKLVESHLHYSPVRGIQLVSVEGLPGAGNDTHVHLVNLQPKH